MEILSVTSFLQALGILCVPSTGILLLKWKLADKKCKEYLDKWDECSDKLTQSYVDNSKLMGKISDMQSKRDKHKQEQSSWAKQRANFKKRIKELEEKNNEH